MPTCPHVGFGQPSLASSTVLATLSLVSAICTTESGTPDMIIIPSRELDDMCTLSLRSGCSDGLQVESTVAQSTTGQSTVCPRSETNSIGLRSFLLREGSVARHSTERLSAEADLSGTG